jgi:phosphatidylglycerol:prolipoprotein diacylglycerol transferase
MHPILFRLGSFEIGTFGLLVAIGFFAAYLLALKRTVRAGFPEDKVANLLILCLIAGLIGAKVFHVLVNFRQGPLTDLIFSRRGMVFYGGLLFGIVTGWIMIRRYQWNVAQVADLLAPSVALGEVFGRIGCLLNGCCFGKVCHSWIGVRFPRIEYKGDIIGSDPFYHHWIQGLIPPDAPSSLPVYPTQAFSSLAALVTFILLIYVIAPRARFHGQTALTYLLLYATFRFIIEMFRDDPRGFWLPGVSTSQGISLVVVPFVVVMWWYLRQGKISPPE